MKKYKNLGELLVDFRDQRKLTQSDFAAMLDVDPRTVLRWERNVSLIKPEKEKLLVEDFGIPHQVIRNLNSEIPIPIYFDFKRWAYSFTMLSNVVGCIEDFKNDIGHETHRIETLSQKKDFEFISNIQNNQKNFKPLSIEILAAAAKSLPELNLVIRDQSGFHGGHLSILPLKYDSYELLRDQKLAENKLTLKDLSWSLDEQRPVFYFYSIYSNSTDNNFYLMNRLLLYFKAHRMQNYTFAGMSFQEVKVEKFKSMGFQIVWEKQLDEHPGHKATFISGNFDKILVEKES